MNNNFSDITIEFAKKNNPLSTIQSGNPVIFDLKEAVEYEIGDDTGMNSYAFNGGSDNYPISITFNDKTLDEVVDAYNNHLQENGIQTTPENVEGVSDRIRMMPGVFVSQRNNIVEISIAQDPELIP